MLAFVLYNVCRGSEPDSMPQKVKIKKHADHNNEKGEAHKSNEA